MNASTIFRGLVPTTNLVNAVKKPIQTTLVTNLPKNMVTNNITAGHSFTAFATGSLLKTGSLQTATQHATGSLLNTGITGVREFSSLNNFDVGSPDLTQARWFATTKTKKLRDPERPKKPMTPFIRYSNVFRDENKEKYSGKEVLKQASVSWKEMVETDKEPYLTPYTAEKAAYDVAFKEYKDSGKLDAWNRDPEKPRKPMTGFMKFAQEFRERNRGSGDKLTEVSKRASQEWRTLSEQEKADYNEKYKQAKVIYDQAIKEYNGSASDIAWKEKTGFAAAMKKKELAKEKEAEKKLKEKEKKAAGKAKKAERAEKQKLKKLEAKEKQKALAEKKAEKKKLDKIKAAEKAKKQKERAMKLAMAKKEKAAKAAKIRKAKELKKKELAKEQTAKAMVLRKKKAEKAKAMQAKKNEKAKVLKAKKAAVKAQKLAAVQATKLKRREALKKRAEKAKISAAKKKETEKKKAMAAKTKNGKAKKEQKKLKAAAAKKKAPAGAGAKKSSKKAVKKAAAKKK